MSNHPDHSEDNFVMNADEPIREDGDDREAFFAAKQGGFDLRAHAPLIAGALALVLIILLGWLLFSGGRGAPNSEAVAQLDSRMAQLEEKLAKIEWLDQALARLNKQENDFAALSEKVAQLEITMNQELAQVGKKLEAVKSAPAATPPQAAAAVESDAPKPSRPAVHVVTAGETLYRISRKYGVSVDDLRRFNQLPEKTDIYPGQQIKLTP